MTDGIVSAKFSVEHMRFSYTRIFKYVGFPFALSADGVKVLKPLDGFIASFLHSYLSIRLPNAGYSCHFKFLKEVSVPKPRAAFLLDMWRNDLGTNAPSGWRVSWRAAGFIWTVLLLMSESWLWPPGTIPGLPG